MQAYLQRAQESHRPLTGPPPPPTISGFERVVSLRCVEGLKPQLGSIFFIHSPADGHLGCVHVLGIINSVAVNIGVCISFWIWALIFSVYVPRRWIAGSYGYTIFSFLRNLNKLFSVVAVPDYIPISLHSLHTFFSIYYL